MMRFLSLLLVLLLPQLSSADCKACLFDGNDADSCIIYGKLGDQVVEWGTGSRECKGYYSIAINGIDPETSCKTTNAFINSLKFGDLQTSDSKFGLGVASEGGVFFEQAASKIDLADSITIDGETTNCEANANNCWNAMKPYFESGDGFAEKKDVCDTLYNKVRVDRNLEESTLRIRLCQEKKEGNIIPLECDPLATQVGDIVTEQPALNCSGFGFETPLSQVAGCEDALENIETTPGGSGGSSGSSGSSGSGTTTESGSGSSTVSFKHTSVFGMAMALLLWT